MPDPVAIKDVFNDVAERMGMRLAEEDSLRGSETDAAVIDAAAAEFGIPLDQLAAALSAETDNIAAVIALIGPGGALGGSMMMAFVAGVAWEQGRSA